MGVTPAQSERTAEQLKINQKAEILKNSQPFIELTQRGEEG